MATRSVRGKFGGHHGPPGLVAPGLGAVDEVAEAVIGGDAPLADNHAQARARMAGVQAVGLEHLPLVLIGHGRWSFRG